jgi:outer membrane protein assembly factor BamB
MDSSKIISLEDFTSNKNEYPSEEESLHSAIELCNLIDHNQGDYPLLHPKNIYIENDTRWVTAHPPLTPDASEALFRVGAVLHYLMTRTPFRISHFLDGPPPVRERNPQISIRLEAIVTRLLQTVRSQRYLAVSELRQDLERLEKELKGDLKVHWGCFKGSGTRPNSLPGASFDPNGRTLKEVWRAELGEIWSSPIIAGENIFIGAGDGNFCSLDSRTGKVIWKIQTGGRIESTPCIDKNIAYLGNDLGSFYAINLKSGSVLWKKALGEYVRSSGYCDGESLYIGSINPTRRSGFFWALSCRNGGVLWKRQMGPVFSSPVVDHDEIIIGSDDETLYCFSSTGTQKWRLQLSGKIRSTPAAARDAIYVGSFGGIFYRIKRSSGEILWQSQIDASFYSSPAVARGLLATGNNAGAILYFQPSTGKQNGHFATGGPVTASPLIVHQFVLAGSNDGNFYILDSHAKLICAFDANSPINSSAAFHDPYIYVGSEKGLHALAVS